MHVSEEKIYKDNVFASCALDWILTAELRFALAQFQVQHGLFFWEENANYGPIIVKRRLDQQTAGLRDCIADHFEINPDPNPGGVLHLDEPWPATPLKFRSQFSSIFDTQNLKEIALDETGLTLSRIGNALLAGGPLSSQDQAALGQYLFQLGDEFHRLSRDFKIAGARRHDFYSERIVDEILDRIKQSLPYQRRTGNDFDTRLSFLGTLDQWDKFLAWEAHDGNAYRAAAAFLSKQLQKSTHRSGDLSRSERQRDLAGPIREAVKAIQYWYPKIYPVRNVAPISLHRPKA